MSTRSFPVECFAPYRTEIPRKRRVDDPDKPVCGDSREDLVDPIQNFFETLILIVNGEIWGFRTDAEAENHAVNHPEIFFPRNDFSHLIDFDAPQFLIAADSRDAPLAEPYLILHGSPCFTLPPSPG